MSRIVFLRYDADVYRVSTALAETIEAYDGTEKGALFQEAQPYVVHNGQLAPSHTHHHLEDLTAKATELASRHGAVSKASIDVARSAVVKLTTRSFLSCLDVATLPSHTNGDFLHGPGERHKIGLQEADFLCNCWPHRVCIDRVGDIDLDATPLAEFLLALGAMISQGLQVKPVSNHDLRTNAEVTIDGRAKFLGIVYMGDFNVAAVRRVLRGLHRPKLITAPYLLLGPGEPPMRPRLLDIKGDQAAPQSGVQAGQPAAPELRYLHERDFWKALERNSLVSEITTLVS